MKEKHFYTAILLVTFLLSGFYPALAQQDLPLPRPGTIEGTGTYFEVTDSEYLNVILLSTEPINLILESVLQMIIMEIKAAEGFDTTQTQLTLTGLDPLSTYYKYQDDYHNLQTLTTEADGTVTFLQDLSQPHFVFIQTQLGTKFIKDDATGGDCSSIGTWDAGTKTCTLTTNVHEIIQIDNSNLTLDGAGHNVIGPASGWAGINVPQYREGVTIKNVNVSGFLNGISLSIASNNNVLNCTTSFNTRAGISVGNVANNNYLENNNSFNNQYGIWLYSTACNNILTKNNCTSNNYGIYLDKLSCYNEIYGNNLTHNNYQIYSNLEANNNLIYNNNFIDESNQVYICSDCYDNVFNLEPPDGGNYWSNWTSPDSDADGFVDVPYVFTGGVDYLPWVVQDGWGTPIYMIEQLADQVLALSLQQGIENSLDAKLQAMQQALDDLNENNDVAAINKLEAFINEVEAQRGKEIPEEDADALIAAAQAIIAAIESQ